MLNDPANVSLLVYLAVGLVIPFVVDLTTKKLASGSVKQSVLLALSLVSGVLVEFGNTVTAGTSFDWKTAAYGAAFTFITGVATYKGLDKTQLLGRDSVLSNPTATFGLGQQQPIIPAPPVVANPVDGE